MSVERSTGVAEHHPTRTVLTRLKATRLVAVAAVSALGLLPVVAAHAVTSSEQVAATTKAIDTTAQRWFTAQADAARINASIADVEHQIAIAEASMEQTRKIATERAVVIYKNSDIGLPSIFGENALDSARRAHLVDDANAGGDAAIAKLTIAVDDLTTQRKTLQSDQAEQQKILQAVAAERTTLDSELAGVRSEVRQEAAVALAAARDRAGRLRADARVRAFVSAQTNDPLAAPTGPSLPTDIVPVVSAPANDGRVSSHHNDPFLVCTRARESAGRYDIVSGSGYYGAYQFLPSTWDTTAIHAARRDLVGVLPSRASEFDQDEMAWALYQWQGKSPWGGRC